MIGGFQPVAFQPAFQQVAISTGAGRKRRIRRYVVRVDGQDFEFWNEQEAEDFLKRVAEVATKAAQARAEETITREIPRVKSLGKVPQVRIMAPKIKVPKDLEDAAQVARRAIAKTYRDASLHAEMALLMAIQAQRDDDDEAISILLM